MVVDSQGVDGASRNPLSSFGSSPYGSRRYALQSGVGGGPKIRTIINYEHVARVLKIRREMCIGEGTRRERGGFGNG